MASPACTHTVACRIGLYLVHPSRCSEEQERELRSPAELCWKLMDKLVTLGKLLASPSKVGLIIPTVRIAMTII